LMVEPVSVLPVTMATDKYTIALDLTRVDAARMTVRCAETRA
jgi:hypothetical protein